MKLSRQNTERLLTVVVYFAALVTVGLLQFFPWFGGLERTTYDYVVRLRGVQPVKADVVVIAMDEPSQQQPELGPLPWSRAVHAALLDRLIEGGARMAVFDVIFDAEKPEADPIFADAITRFGKVVLGKELDRQSDPRYAMEQTIEPAPALTQAGATTGYVSTPLDEDKVRRSYWIVNGDRTLETEPHFRLTGEQIEERDGKLFLAGKEVPFSGSPEQPEFRINFVGPARTIPTQSYYQVLAGTIPKDFLKDKVVFIGADLIAQNTTAGAVVDRFATPADMIDPDPVLMSGVEIHANAYHTMATRSFIREASPGMIWLIVAILGAVTTLYVSVMRPVPAGVGTFATSIVAGVLVYWIFVRYNFWLSPVQGIFIVAITYTGVTVLRFRLTHRERAQIQKAFKHYVSVEVLDELMKNPESLALGGAEVEATVLFSDIAGFSQMSEKITPQQLTEMLNQYFETLASLIMKENGMVNKFIGDAVMAIWGAPLENPQHAIDACRASLNMQRAMIPMDPVRCRVGINSGRMIAGNMGSRERFEYTVIGDTVNLASRLEGVNKIYKSDVMISEMTEEKVRGHFLVREADMIRVMGKDKPVRIFQLLDQMEHSSEPEHERWTAMIASFDQALDLYRTRDWAKAKAAFKDHLQLFPEDTVGKLYFERSSHFMSAPPPDDWDGVYQMEVK